MPSQYPTLDWLDRGPKYGPVRSSFKYFFPDCGPYGSVSVTDREKRPRSRPERTSAILPNMQLKSTVPALILVLKAVSAVPTPAQRFEGCS